MAECDELVETLRARLGTSVRRLLTGQAKPAPLRFAPADDDLGLFGPGSAAWQVHADLATIVGGVRAVLLQTLHPLAMAAVADQAVAQVRAIHDRVSGRAPDGRRYEANDPHLLAWIHVTEVDSFLVAHQRYGRRPLDRTGAD